MTNRLSLLAWLALACVACGNRPVENAANSSPPTIEPAVNLDWICLPTDQDQYVYRPARLQPVLPCLRVTGTVMASSVEADGDFHLQVRLDSPYQGLLNAGNEQEDGNLIVEPICRFPPAQADAIRICASDPNPTQGPLPGVGDHVWLEGRYVLDVQHHSWAELHPLYRWGKLNQ